MPSQRPTPQRTIWTVGHSNHPLQELLDLLGQHQISLLVDVRSSPFSRHASQFNREAIAHALRARAIEYLFLGDLLGGRAEGGQFYDPEGYVRYDRLAQSPQFQQGIERLLQEIRTSRVALMCGEEDPTNCHRRLLIGRVLRGLGVAVMHIRAAGPAQTEEEVAAEETFRKTKGQLTLFDLEGPDEWKSTRSVSPGKAPPNSSKSSNRPVSDG
jgi:uncharacterized protein (DUF488 family)